MWQSISIFFFLPEILDLLLYVMPLDCHKKVGLTSYMTPLNLVTDIATKLSKQVLAILRYSASTDDLDTFFFLPWDNRRTKKNTQILNFELSDNLPSMSRNKLSMSDCSRMAITILVPTIVWCTLGLELQHPNEVYVEPVYIDLGFDPLITLYHLVWVLGIAPLEICLDENLWVPYAAKYQVHIFFLCDI